MRAAGLEHSFCHVVNVEEELHFARWVTELRDIRLEVFLHLRSEITKAQTTHLVVPLDDRCLVLLRGVFSNLAINLFIGRAGSNEFLEFHSFETGELPEVGAKATGIEVVLATDAEQIGSSFVEHTCGNDESAECVTRATRRCFP